MLPVVRTAATSRLAGSRLLNPIYFKRSRCRLSVAAKANVRRGPPPAPRPIAPAADPVQGARLLLDKTYVPGRCMGPIEVKNTKGS